MTKINGEVALEKRQHETELEELRSRSVRS